MKSGEGRDRIAKAEKVIAFEIEGAGIDGIMPFSCYQGTSCMKSLLEQWAVADQLGEKNEQRRDSSHESQGLDSEAISEACTVTTRSDEGYHSQHNPDTSDEELLQVMREIDSSFKCVLKSFRKHRRYLPRDADLKKIMKDQRFLVSDHAESLSSHNSNSIDERLRSSKPFCLEIALEINKKLEGIEDITMRLPLGTKAKG
ncbi:uncharacterized protein N7496_008572 [Penicillium cataractarum]|uniref:Uncharacterized protein n=1 Tax=Penicillium cataractarum TaxID=2100454 RepID=A0A9W9RYP5_9EURO|nr:uncharacterized protein N7496_008572 [Penicillium cataractarum]KAJ5368812.1 hypothetical protein N7496_008572 [Penicillium cataractarum]